MDNKELETELKDRFDQIKNEAELLEGFIDVCKSHGGNLEKIRICFKAFRDSVDSEVLYHILTNLLIKTTDVVESFDLYDGEDIMSMYDLIYDKNSISEEELRSKILYMFDYENNTASMVGYFLKIIKTQRGNYKNIQACFKAFVDYCKDEVYFEEMCDAVDIRTYPYLLDIQDHVESIRDLFEQ